MAPGAFAAAPHAQLMDYARVGSEEDAWGRAWRPAFARGWRALPLAAAAAAAALLTREGAARLRARARVAEGMRLQALGGSCGVSQEGVDYDASGAVPDYFDHVPKADMCCSMCQGSPDCLAWVWKDAGLDGEPHRCFVMKTAPLTSAAVPGVVSGMAPERPPFPEGFVPEEEAGEEDEDAEDAGQEDDMAGGFDQNSLFCFSLIAPGGGEAELIRAQHQLRTNIFGCDAFRVFSNVQEEVAPGVVSVPVASDLKCEFHEIAWNTWIFIAVWKAVFDDRTWENHGWIVKTDADSVFMPDRLRVVLQDHPSATWLNNCHYGLHGPLEVLSNSAVQRLSQDYAGGDRPVQCLARYPEAVSGTAQWGEDMFVQACLDKVYGLQPEYDERLMCEDHCDCPDWYWCNNRSDRVSYHPFKKADLYTQCLANALSYSR
ncbi:unnamed protein product [Prorocentrum cordatum]|uniref:Apple domain-containing protein n=1 Tax=Prorocentrum cordatum TaxID=2364126 RepID=A0ABN9Y298_9DINO|nr:unnamed protein product [Polarella glacialis]